MKIVKKIYYKKWVKLEEKLNELPVVNVNGFQSSLLDYDKNQYEIKKLIYKMRKLELKIGYNFGFKDLTMKGVNHD